MPRKQRKQRRNRKQGSRRQGGRGNTIHLAVRLTDEEVEAARKIHEGVRVWKVEDKAIEQLRERFPGFGERAALLKVVVLNTVYGARIFDYRRVTDHVKKTLAETDLRTAGPELVERLAWVPGMGRRLHVFASKFAHLFINNPERFPILDVYAEKSVKFHLGRGNFVRRRRSRYKAFAKNFEKLRSLARVKCTTRQLDHYLWLSGLYRTWRRNRKTRINKDVRRLFAQPSRRESAYLARLPV